MVAPRHKSRQDALEGRPDCYIPEPALPEVSTKGELAGWLAVFVLMLAGFIVLWTAGHLTVRGACMVIVGALLPRVGFGVYLWWVERR